MKVILLQDLNSLGKMWDVKDVADGYARNHLFLKGLAKPASDAAIQEVEELKREEAKRAEKELKDVQELATKIDGLDLTLTAKVGSEGTLFASISEQGIAEALKALGHPIQRSQIHLENPIKELGEYKGTVGFPHGLEAQLKIIVEEEKKKEKMKE